MHQTQADQRSLPRLLCDDSFMLASVSSEGSTTEIMPVNFNRNGMAFSSIEPINIAEDALLSFTYASLDQEFNFGELAVELVYRQDTDIGSQYGVKFCADVLTNEDIYQNLIIVEQHLEKKDRGQDRYGLFS